MCPLHIAFDPSTPLRSHACSCRFRVRRTLRGARGRADEQERQEVCLELVLIKHGFIPM